MARKPEVVAAEKAQKAIEKAERAAERRRKKEEALANMSPEEKKELADKEKKKKEELLKKEEEKALKAAQVKVEVIENPEAIKKKELTSFVVVGDQDFPTDFKDQTRRKTCVEYEKTKKDGSTEVQDKVHSVRFSEKDKKYLAQQNELIETYFFKSGTVPRYNKYICSCCGKLKKLEEFQKSYSFVNIGRMDDGYVMHASYCKDCAKKIFFYHYNYTCNKNEELAMERFCCDTNTYWDAKCYLEARRLFENNPTSVSIVSEYLGAIGRDRVMGKTYWQSPTIVNRVYSDGDTIKNNSNQTVGMFAAPLDWSKEDTKIRKKIIKLLRFDPFEFEDEDDKKILYRSLDMIIDDTMEEDYVKLQAAIEIVRSFNKIEKWRRKERELELEGADTKQIQELTKLRNEEMKSITSFSKDHGFAERYTNKKNKGAGTLTGSMNEMKEAHYQEGLVDYYGVKTCKEMQEAADLSIQAIMKQLALGENELYGMVQKQADTIRKLYRQVDDLTENLRQANIKIKEQILIDKAKAEGTYDIEEFEDEIEEEIDSNSQPQGETLDTIMEQLRDSNWIGDEDGD